MQLEKIRLIFDLYTEGKVRKYSVPFLRMTIGTTYSWFALLKITNTSPVAPLIEASYFFLPFPASLIFLGFWELFIGFGFLSNQFLRTATISLWLQMIGITGAAILTPSLFFASIFELTLEGEFLIKDAILVAASLVVLSYKDHSVEKPLKIEE